MTFELTFIMLISHALSIVEIKSYMQTYANEPHPVDHRFA